MPNDRRGLSLQILAILADVQFPGLTRGEIRARLQVPADTEITARIRELRDRESYGAFDVRVEKIRAKEFTYYLLPNERRRAKEFLANWKAA
jgi:hypothetical protein